MTPQAFRPGPKSPGTAGRHCGPSDTGPSRPGQKVHPVSPRTLAQVTWDSWWNHSPLDPGVSHSGQLVDTVGTQTWARVARDHLLKPLALGPGPNTWESWSNPPALGTGPESPRAAGHTREPSDPSPGHLDRWSNCGPSDLVPGHKGQLLKRNGPWARAQVTWDSWSTPQPLGPGPESQRAAGQHRGPSDTDLGHPTGSQPRRPSEMSPSRPGELVDPVGLQT